jgi:hypothetical protein
MCKFDINITHTLKFGKSTVSGVKKRVRLFRLYVTSFPLFDFCRGDPADRPYIEIMSVVVIHAAACPYYCELELFMPSFNKFKPKRKRRN